jgi:hypothetical protein
MSIEHPRFESEYPKDFRIMANDFLHSFHNAEKKRERLFAGPEFLITGGKSGDVTVNTVIHEFESVLNKSQKFRSYALFEKSAKYGLVGIRGIDFDFYSSADGLSGTIGSDVNISRRGEGYLRPLETVTIFVIQNEANRINGSLVWKISNNNLEELEKIERRQGADSPQAVEKKAEQERWRKFYSEENLGIVSTDREYGYERVFHKEGDYVEMEKVAQIAGPVLEKGVANLHPVNSDRKTFTLNDVMADLERVK